MKSKIRIIFITLISLALMLSLVSCTKSEEEISDNTDNTKLPIQSETPDVCPVCKCELDNHTPKISISYIFEDGVLTICGNGSMEQLYIDGKAPWAEYADEIITVNIYFGVKSIGADAFSGCENLKTVYMENEIESIGNNAFFGCKKLEGIKLPDSLRIIGSYAFNSCESITEIYIPEGVTDIGEGAFALCPRLAKVNIPSTVVIIGELVFAGCSPDIVLTVSENNKYYTYDGKALITKDGTLLIFVHPSLPEYTVPETVTSIGKCAFYNCLLIENIKLPKSIKLIGSGVFDGCIKLKDIHYDGTAYDWTEVVGMEAVATAYAYIKINVIPVCGFCGSSEHTTHPTCPECGSYDHIEHPKLIMGHLSDEELLVYAKQIIEKFLLYSGYESSSSNFGVRHDGKEYFALYKNANDIKKGELNISKIYDVSASVPVTGHNDIMDIMSNNSNRNAPIVHTIEAGTFTLVNPYGINTGNETLYYDPTLPASEQLYLASNFKTLEDYYDEVFKYTSHNYCNPTEVIRSNTHKIFEVNGRLFITELGFAVGTGSAGTDFDYNTMKMSLRNSDKCIIQITGMTYPSDNEYTTSKFELIMENGNLVIDKVY